MFASTLLDRRREAERWFEEANAWVRSGRSWRLRLLFLVEVAEWELARGNLGTALNFFRAAQTEADQRSDLIPLETHYHVIEMLWISHARGDRDALAYIGEKVEMLRSRAALTYLTAACGRATLELAVLGEISAESAELMRDTRWQQIPGRRALLQAEGLYPSQPIHPPITS
jgi:hypothetical protein